MLVKVGLIFGRILGTGYEQDRLYYLENASTTLSGGVIFSDCAVIIMSLSMSMFKSCE
jgi:hypothetical protein